jgi:acetoin utilization deacetylase AcuC-like enzyme
LDSLIPVKPRKITEEELLRFHTQRYIDYVKTVSDSDQGGDVGNHAMLSHGGYDIARLSAGGCLEALDALMRGDISNAYCLVRPPGHHAEADMGMGFCIFNNIVLAARHAQQVHGVKKIAIVDWDVHHGNGGQKAFWEEDDVLMISIHQKDNYPRPSGNLPERGAGKGLGYNLNIPMPAGCGNGAYRAAFERVIVPALDAFKPDLLLISCGYDPCVWDPLGQTLVCAPEFGYWTKLMKRVANDHCKGRLMMLHEGGYSKEMVPFCGLFAIQELCGISTEIKDPFAHLYQLGGHDLEKHQDELITKCEAFVAELIELESSKTKAS